MTPAWFRGALLGLAAGDALGTTLEFVPPWNVRPLTDLVGGGPFGLKPGQWTDDTSMALCLAESLVERGFDPVHQLGTYVRWYRRGHLSSTGGCFDIGNTTRLALHRFEEQPRPFPGPTGDDAAGESSRTTHRAPACVDACRYFAPPVAEVAAGSLQVRQPPAIRGTGFVVKSLEAALWAFHRAVHAGDRGGGVT